MRFGRKTHELFAKKEGVASPTPPKINTSTGEVSENHSVWRGGGGQIMPPSISTAIRATATKFLGVPGATFELKLAKILGSLINLLKVK